MSGIEETEKVPSIDGSSDASADPKATISGEIHQQSKDHPKSLKKRKMRSAPRRRLTGGADESSPGAESSSSAEHQQGQTSPHASMPAAPLSQDIHGEGSPATDSTTAASRPSSEGHSEKEHLPSTGDPRVDEMLERALSNLQEAGKALASLGENVEHELKLFLVELMGRTRKWTGQVEGKIRWAHNDILELHHELTNLIGQLEDSKRELTEVKERAEKAEESQQKSMDSRGQADKTAMMSGHDASRSGSPSRSEKPGGAASKAASMQASRCASRVLDDLACDESPEANKRKAAEAERLQQCCAELEEEILCLRKQNEKIVKERAEYESAIQRALLKGVSSLNVETLKVLRCAPPVSCCPPGSSESTSIEPTSKGRASGCPGGSAGNGKNRRSSASHDSRESIRRQCPAADGRSEHKSKRHSRDNGNGNMLLLMHQRDAESFGIQSTTLRCPGAEAAKKPAICSGGNCGKSTC